MSGKRLTNRRKDFISVCYLIDVAPDKFRGGGQMYLVNLIHEVQVQSSKFKVQSFGGPSANILVRFLWCLCVIPQVIFYHFFKYRFDLIHAHSLPAMAAGKVLSVILGIPIVVTVHGSSLPDKVRPWRTPGSDLFRFLERLILTKIQYDVQITVSRNFLEVSNVNKNVIYIPNGVDIVKFTKLHTPPRSFVNFKVLFVGRKNDPVKGFKILESAFKLVKKKIPNVKLLVAGGSLPPEEVINLYRQADLFVLPSLSEGFPLTLLEAWAAKLPAVATAVGEIPYLFGMRSFVNFSEEVYETKIGYMIEPGNPNALAEAIVIALRNKHLAKIGENGYNVARQYSWSLIAKKTAEVYNQVVIDRR